MATSTNGGLTGDFDKTSIIPPTLAEFTGGDLVHYEQDDRKGIGQMREGLTQIKNNIAQDASLRWSNPSAKINAPIGSMDSSGVGEVKGADNSMSPQIKDWRKDQANQWEMQKEGGMTSYVSAEDAAAGKFYGQEAKYHSIYGGGEDEDQSAPTKSSQPPPQQYKKDANGNDIPGLHDMSTYQGRKCLCETTRILGKRLPGNLREDQRGT